MKVTSAIKALEKAGYTIGKHFHAISAVKMDKPMICFFKNGNEDEVTCIHTMKAMNKDSRLEPNTYWDNIGQVIKALDNA